MSEQFGEHTHLPDQKPPGHEFSQFPWLPFPMRGLQDERRTVIAAHDALPSMIDAIKTAEEARLDIIRADAEANIEAVKRAADKFIADTRAAVNSEEERSSINLTAYDDKLTQVTDLVADYDTAGRQLVTGLNEFETLINERSDLDAIVEGTTALLAEKTDDQARKVEESLEIEARLQVANQKAETARIEGTKLTSRGEVGEVAEWVPDIYDGDNVRRRTIEKAATLANKKHGVVSEIGQLYVDIHELTSQLSIANSQTYPTLLEKLEVKKAEALALRAELARISSDVAECVDAVSTKNVTAAIMITEKVPAIEDTEIVFKSTSDELTQPVLTDADPLPHVPSHRDVPSSPLSIFAARRSVKSYFVGGQAVKITELRGN